MPWLRALVPHADALQRVRRRLRDRRFARAVLDTTVAAAVLLATVLLFWFGYGATREWERSNRESVQRRGNEMLMLLRTALERDMRGAFTTVLLPLNERTLQRSSRYELADRFAGAFARFPYVESFFVWRQNAGTSSSYFFNRADQPPPWDRPSEDDDIHPVLIRSDPAATRHVIDGGLKAASGARFAAFDVTVEGVPHQAFVHLLYGGPLLNEVISFAGFTVSLPRVRESYFQDFIQHLQDLTGNRSISIEIADDRGALVARTGPRPTGDQIGVKRFALLFADPSLLPFLTPDDRAIVWWNAGVGVGAEASMLAAERATARTLAALVVAALVTVGAVAWTVRAARAVAGLATAQSEFVSAMSHEMKTPLSLIGLASDTLANGRYDSPATVREYGRMLSREARHLRRLIDNVLCYARLDLAESAQSFEPLDVSELIQDSVERFRPLLADLDVEAEVQLPLDAVWIRGDRGMMPHVLDNLVDNAARHGGEGRRLTVRAAVEGHRVRIDVADAGKGIPPEELTRIFDQFYRGKYTRTPGSGLGLAIVRRILADHGGTVAVVSHIGQGTTVTVLLPVGADRSSAPTPAM